MTKAAVTKPVAKKPPVRKAKANSEFKRHQVEVTQAKLEKRNQCQFCLKITALPKEKISDFYDAILDADIEPQTIFDVLTKWGVDTSYTALRNHRSGTKGFAAHMANIKKAAGLK